MPIVDGLEATRELRRLPEMMDMPIIALTGLAMPGDEARCLDAGCNDYLSKPLDLNDLHRKISQYITIPVDMPIS